MYNQKKDFNMDFVFNLQTDPKVAVENPRVDLLQNETLSNMIHGTTSVISQWTCPNSPFETAEDCENYLNSLPMIRQFDDALEMSNKSIYTEQIKNGCYANCKKAYRSLRKTTEALAMNPASGHMETAMFINDIVGRYKGITTAGMQRGMGLIRNLYNDLAVTFADMMPDLPSLAPFVAHLGQTIADYEDLVRTRDYEMGRKRRTDSPTKLRPRVIEEYENLMLTVLGLINARLLAGEPLRPEDEQLLDGLNSVAHEFAMAARQRSSNIEENGKIEITITCTNGGTTAGNGKYRKGEQITITATANNGYMFAQWSDGNQQATRRITVSETQTRYHAIFVEVPVGSADAYTINLQVTPEGGGSVTITDTASHTTLENGSRVPAGKVIQITATPKSQDYVFNRWSDGQTLPQRELTVTQNINLSAYFSQAPADTGDNTPSADA